MTAAAEHRTTRRAWRCGPPAHWPWRAAGLTLLVLLWVEYMSSNGAAAQELPAVHYVKECQSDPPVLCASTAGENRTAGCMAAGATTNGTTWTCTVARNCVRAPAFWVHPEVLEGWPERFRVAAPLCGGQLTYLEALRRDWPPELAEHGPAAACAELGLALAELLAAYDLNVDWGEAPVRPPALATAADAARVALDDCCAGENLNATQIHLRTQDLYTYVEGRGLVAACPDPYARVPVPLPLSWAAWYRALVYEDGDPTRLTTAGQAANWGVAALATLVLLAVAAQTPALRGLCGPRGRGARAGCCGCGSTRGSARL